MLAKFPDVEWDGAGPPGLGEELEAAGRVCEAVEGLLEGRGDPR